MTEDKSKSLAIHQNDSLVRVERSIALTNKLLSTIDDNTVTDIDGNVYKTVKIGNQIWMAENLKVTRYRNGDPISTGYTDKEWGELNSGAYCYYYDVPKYIELYGNLYNWYAADDERGICPVGWHVPTDEEWKELEVTLGMSNENVNVYYYRGTNQGAQLAGETNFWKQGRLVNNSSFGSSGFLVLPGGFRDKYGEYMGIGTNGFIWTSDEEYSGYAIFRMFHYDSSDLSLDINNIQGGGSIRCIKD
jgi:uncharacterized protein (TIGR02145 family)